MAAGRNDGQKQRITFRDLKRIEGLLQMYIPRSASPQTDIIVKNKQTNNNNNNKKD